jgi:hypothetical protein
MVVWLGCFLHPSQVGKMRPARPPQTVDEATNPLVATSLKSHSDMPL